MKTIRNLVLAVATSLASLAAAEKPGALSAEQKTFLASYESVRAALAADDLAAASKAAVQLTKAERPRAAAAAQKIAAAQTIGAARQAFKTLSKEALTVAKGQPGYFRANCPMVPNGDGDWVQTSRKISNPYFGKSMLTCGTIESN